MDRRRVLLAAIALIVAACGGSSESTTTTEAIVAGGSTETTTTESPTTTAAPTTTEAPTTTTTEAAAGGSDCLVGTWELDSAAFIEQIFSVAAEGETGFEDLGDVEVSHGGGSFTVTMNADGSFVGDRDNWQIRVSAADGVFVNTLDGEETGTWSTDGDQLTIVSESSTIEVSFAAEIDGELQPLPFGGTQTVATRELGGAGPYTCDDNTLEVTLGGGTSTFAHK